jgi:hypothetical protein
MVNIKPHLTQQQDILNALVWVFGAVKAIVNMLKN